jgi:hypothetical protein
MTNGIDNNTYNFYAIVIDGSNCTITKNSSKQSAIAYSALPTNINRTSNYIGRSNWSGDNTFGGSIADLAIYRVALTDAEIAQNFAEQSAAQIDSITSVAPANALVGGSTYTLLDTSTSQISPTHTVDASSTSVCSLAGNVVSFIGAGTCKINSVAPANTSYSASAVVSQSFSVTGNTSLSFAFSGNATYRQVTSLSVSLSPTPGRITFYAGGKAIPGRKNVAVSSSPFICSWKPAQHTTINITALYDPTPNGYSTLTTAPVAIRVVPRSGTR